MKLSAIKAFKKHSNHGFTLVEILLATGIAAFTLCAVLATYISCFALIENAKNITIATSVASNRMEDIQATPFGQIINNLPNWTPFTVTAIPLSRGEVTIADVTPPGWPAGTLLEVTVSVCWNQRGRMMGEDTNLNGSLDAGEDANNNGVMDYPVQLVTQIARI